MVRPDPGDSDSAVLRRRLPSRQQPVHLSGCDELGSAGAHRSQRRAQTVSLTQETTLCPSTSTAARTPLAKLLRRSRAVVVQEHHAGLDARHVVVDRHHFDAVARAAPSTPASLRVEHRDVAGDHRIRVGARECRPGVQSHARVDHAPCSRTLRSGRPIVILYTAPFCSPW